MMSLRLGVLSVLLLGVQPIHGQMQCKDMNNNNVDWFAFYKLPENKKSDDEQIHNGTAFLYLDANNKQWVRPTASVMDSNQAIAFTLQQIYAQKGNPSVLSIFYNDEFPDNETSFDLGHTKGVTSFDAVSGFWLIHSVPKFPPADHYFYPPNAHYFGQMGICVSVASGNAGVVANQLYYTQPFIYQFNLPSQFASLYPTFTDVKNGKYQNMAPFSSKKVLPTLAGTQFIHFAKAKGFSNDLYGALIAPTLSTSLYTETWQHQPGNLGPWCTSSFEVLDAKDISLPFGIQFSNWNDHSKYAVAVKTGSNLAPPPYVCIGDINRQQHQTIRGGGSLCLKDSALHATFRAMVRDSFSCPQLSLLELLTENRIPV